MLSCRIGCWSVVPCIQGLFFYRTRTWTWTWKVGWRFTPWNIPTAPMILKRRPVEYSILDILRLCIFIDDIPNLYLNMYMYELIYTLILYNPNAKRNSTSRSTQGMNCVLWRRAGREGPLNAFLHLLSCVRSASWQIQGFLLPYVSGQGLNGPPGPVFD